MIRNPITLAGAIAVCLLACQLHAQTNPAPATYLENFEQQTNIILVKGFSLVGSLAVDNSTILVHTREANDVSHSQKAYGILLECSLPTTPGEEAKLSLVVDYDELDSLANGMDYVSKVTWGVTQLDGFEAFYATRSGFRVIAHSNRRQEAVNTYIQFGAYPRMAVSSDQLLQLRSLILQAKTSLDALK